MFWPLTRPKMPFKVMHRKQVTHFNGSYKRKSRWQKLADEMGRGKKNPIYSHRLTHRKRVTSERHDSYFRSMTITQAIPKIAEVTHPDRQISEEIAEVWRRVHITAWEFEGNIKPSNWTKGGQASTVGEGGGRAVVRKASTQQSGFQGSGWAALENEKDTTLTAITLGLKYFSYVRSLAPSHTQNLSNPFCTLTNKKRGKYFYKEVFLRLSLLLYRWDAVDEYITECD